MPSWVQFIPAIVTASVGLAGLLGLAKYLIGPWYVARALRRKYATALWIACSELQIHFKRIRQRLAEKDDKAADALKKIPRYDWAKRADWFAKEGYYATTTAYKIASVSAWLRIYQRELLFLPYAASQHFLSRLYACADALKISMSTETCFWFDYLDAVGDGLVPPLGSAGEQRSVIPMSFADFCHRYATDQQFLFFYDQLQMYIHHLGDRKPAYLGSVDNALKALAGLIGFLREQKLLPGFEMDRPAISQEEMARPMGPAVGPQPV